MLHARACVAIIVQQKTIKTKRGNPFSKIPAGYNQFEIIKKAKTSSSRSHSSFFPYFQNKKSVYILSERGSPLFCGFHFQKKGALNLIQLCEECNLTSNGGCLSLEEIHIVIISTLRKWFRAIYGASTFGELKGRVNREEKNITVD